MTILESFETGDRYELGALLGEGGFGAAFEAVKLPRPRGRKGPPVCLKLNHWTEAWHRECYFGEVMKGVPGAVQLLDSFVAMDHGEPAYCSVFELAECSLADRLTDDGLDWTEKRVLREFRRVVATLVLMHEWGAMHRDVTPMNILMMPPTGRLKLGDFGIATQGKKGKVGADAFNPWHAPESKMLEGSQWRPRDDVWQLGQLLASLIRGHGVTIIRSREVKHLNCADSTKALVYRCITKPPHRFGTAAELLWGLDNGADIRMSTTSSVRGKRLVFTGPMAMRRDEMTKRAKRAGAVVQDDVGWATDLVVVGDESPHWVAGSSGMKILQALALRDKESPLKFITDTTFLRVTR